MTCQQHTLRLLGFANDLDTIEGITDVRVLETEASKIGLQINASKTEVMELINSGEHSEEREGLTFEKVDDFRYLGASSSTKNDWSK